MPPICEHISLCSWQETAGIVSWLSSRYCFLTLQKSLKPSMSTCAVLSLISDLFWQFMGILRITCQEAWVCSAKSLYWEARAFARHHIVRISGLLHTGREKTGSWSNLKCGSGVLTCCHSSPLFPEGSDTAPDAAIELLFIWADKWGIVKAFAQLSHHKQYWGAHPEEGDIHRFCWEAFPTNFGKRVSEISSEARTRRLWNLKKHFFRFRFSLPDLHQKMLNTRAWLTPERSKLLHCMPQSSFATIPRNPLCSVQVLQSGPSMCPA